MKNTDQLNKLYDAGEHFAAKEFNKAFTEFQRLYEVNNIYMKDRIKLANFLVECYLESFDCPENYSVGQMLLYNIFRDVLDTSCLTNYLSSVYHFISYHLCDDGYYKIIYEYFHKGECFQIKKDEVVELLLFEDKELIKFAAQFDKKITYNPRIYTRVQLANDSEDGATQSFEELFFIIKSNIEKDIIEHNRFLELATSSQKNRYEYTIPKLKFYFKRIEKKKKYLNKFITISKKRSKCIAPYQF